jgi:hypothetical protein
MPPVLRIYNQSPELTAIALQQDLSQHFILAFPLPWLTSLLPWPHGATCPIHCRWAWRMLRPPPTTSESPATRCSTAWAHAVGKHVSSSIFSAGGCHWNVRFYPDGCKENASGSCASVFLHLIWATMDVRVKYSLSILQKDGSAILPVVQQMSSKRQVTTEATTISSPSPGWRLVVPRQGLLDNQVRVNCHQRVSHWRCWYEFGRQTSLVHVQNCQANIGTILALPQFGDRVCCPWTDHV